PSPTLPRGPATGNGRVRQGPGSIRIKAGEELREQIETTHPALLFPAFSNIVTQSTCVGSWFVCIVGSSVRSAGSVDPAAGDNPLTKTLHCIAFGSSRSRSPCPCIEM